MRVYINNIFKSKKENTKDDTVFIKDEIVEEKDKLYSRKGAVNNSKLRKKCENEYTEKEKKKILNKHNLPKSYYALLTFMIMLAGISISLLKKSNNSLLEEDYAVFNNQTIDIYEENINELSSKELELQNTNSSNADTRNEFVIDTSSVNSNNVITKVQEKVNNIVEKKEEPLVFAKPIDGEISKIFSDDKVIYSKTLEMWKTHDGIDIKADEGEIVYAIERGIVEKVYNDAFYGVTIVVDHGQGYKTSYSNLSEDTFIETGDKIKKLQKIGKIGTTSIGEIKDEPHLHFMLYKNNVISDPTSIFK